MKTKVHKTLEGAFGRANVAKAKELASGYHIILERSAELGYIGSSVELPTVFADDKDPGECVKAIQEALIYVVATMITSGRKPPSSAKQRSVQVNMRLTPYEKLLLSSRAKSRGYKGVSDFLRNGIIKELLKTS